MSLNDPIDPLRESIRLTSPQQLEIRERITFPTALNNVSYGVEMYFFFPSSLQVTSDSFSSASLLKTLKNYIRLRAKKVPLENFFDKKGPFENLTVSLELFEKSNTVDANQYEDNLKRFSMTYRYAMLAELDAIDADTDEKRISRTLTTIQNILDHYRSLRDSFEALEVSIPSHAFQYCDEFMSLLTSKRIREKAMTLGKTASRLMLDFLNREKSYIEKNFPQSIVSQANTKESVLFRWSLLKKFVSSSLYLEAKTLQGKPLLLHSLYGLAAALSMLAATTVNFSWRDGTFGSLSLWILVALLLTYILKNRIREVLRNWLFEKFEKWIPDRRLHLFHRKTLRSGYVNESFRFIEKKNLPERIVQLRNRAHTIPNLSNRIPESLLLYKKHVQITEEKLLAVLASNSVLDIMRFNIKDFLKHADTPMEEIPLQDDEEATQGTDSKILAEKIYHVYIARRITIGGQIGHDLVRLIISMNGIKQMEVVSPLIFEKADR